MMWFMITILLACSITSALAKCSNPGTHGDLPNPPSIMETLEVGDLVIPMDSKQDIDGIFNLHTYGFIVHLLWGDVNASWVIKACKIGVDANDIDGVQVHKILPEDSSSMVETLDFSNGAIVVPQESAAAAMEVYNAFIEKGADPPVVYSVQVQLAAPVEVEVRHKFVDKPKIGILGDSKIHATVFDDAGLVEGIHYHALGTDAELIIDPKNCFTLVSNSHDTLTIAPERASAVRTFTRDGGNFFAQDSAAVTYEANALNQGVRFLFSASECMSDKMCSPIKKGEKMSTGEISQPDLALAQFNQTIGFDYAQGGRWNSGDSSFAQGNYDPSKAYLELSDGTNFKAMAGTIIDYSPSRQTGGMVFYLAGRSYDQCGNSINGVRMLLNAVLIPSYKRDSSCNLPTDPNPTTRTLNIRSRKSGNIRKKADPPTETIHIRSRKSGKSGKKKSCLLNSRG